MNLEVHQRYVYCKARGSHTPKKKHKEEHYSLEKWSWKKMAQRVKVLIAKPNDLSPFPPRRNAEPYHQKTVFCPLHKCMNYSQHIYMHTQIDR